MNHYPHHIGDFNTATRHLSRLERAVYRDMRDMYFDKERPLDGSDFDRLARRLVCVTPDEIAALQFVLDEFFEQDDEGLWVHHECEQVIAAYRAQQEASSIVRANENDRQIRSRARRAAIFSELRKVGEAPAWNAKMRDLLALCRQHGIAVPTEGPVTPPVTASAVTRNAPDTANQNQNHNQIPPNPPAGGASAGEAAPNRGRGERVRAGRGGGAAPAAAMATATALFAFFPEVRRIRIADVAREIDALLADGTATAEQLLQAAAQQAGRLGMDEGKACPSVLRWLRDSRWLDAAAEVGQAEAIPENWRDTRSGVEAMGIRLGLGPWDPEKDKLFQTYDRRVGEAYEASIGLGVPA